MKKSILVAAIALLSAPVLMAVKNVEVAVLDSTISETTGGKDKSFFTSYFRLLSGDKQLQRDIEKGKNADEIRTTWKDDLKAFEAIRAKYLMY